VTKGTIDFNIENVLRKDQFNFIQDMHLELHVGRLLMSAARMIVDSCIQLTGLKGIITWSIKCHALQNFLYEMKQAYPGVHIL